MENPKLSKICKKVSWNWQISSNDLTYNNNMSVFELTIHPIFNFLWEFLVFRIFLSSCYVTARHPSSDQLTERGNQKYEKPEIF